jgi:thiamine biosynthesis lipoprotein
VRLLPCLAAFIVVATPGSLRAERHEFAEPHMGTVFRIVLQARSVEVAREGAQAAFARIAALDEALSDYRASSELSRLCARAGGPPVAVGRDLFAVLTRAEEVALRSRGAFDVTVGPLTRLWRRALRSGVAPAREALADARARVAHDLVRLDRKTQTVALLRPGIQLDLGGIAKGYAADEALAVLRQKGLAAALVAAGGDVVAGDSPPGEAGWHVSLAPFGPTGASETILLREGAVSTSGDAEQWAEIDGRRYSHIVDPRTGWGLTGRRASIVVAHDGTTADALATALTVMEVADGLALAESTPGVAARVLREGKQGMDSSTSARWAQLPRPKAEAERTATR